MANKKQDDKKTNKNQQRQMTRTKYPKTTQDGRPLGRPYADDIPDHLKNVIPPKNSHRTKEDRQKAMVKAMTRAFAPHLMPTPLGLQPDGDIDTPKGIKARINGLNQAKFNVLISSLKRGATQMIACQAAGITYQTFLEWRSKGEQGIHPYAFVAQAINEAVSELHIKMLEGIVSAGMLTERYDEVTKEHQIDPQTGEHEMVETKRVTKTQHRKWQALAWYLERNIQELRLIRDTMQNQDNGNSDTDDLLIMDGLTTGQAKPRPADWNKYDDEND